MGVSRMHFHIFVNCLKKQTYFILPPAPPKNSVMHRNTHELLTQLNHFELFNGTVLFKISTKLHLTYNT